MNYFDPRNHIGSLHKTAIEPRNALNVCFSCASPLGSVGVSPVNPCGLRFFRSCMQRFSLKAGLSGFSLYFWHSLRFKILRIL